MVIPIKKVYYIGFLIILTITGCMNSIESNEGTEFVNTIDSERVVTISTNKDLFEFTLEFKKDGNNKVTVIRKIKYNGDEDIIVSHADPLISVIAYSKDSENNYHAFKAIEMNSELKSKEQVVYGAPIVFEIIEENTIISGLAQFEFNEMLYSILIKQEF